jgi:hypothetical protein
MKRTAERRIRERADRDRELGHEKGKVFRPKNWAPDRSEARSRPGYVRPRRPKAPKESRTNPNNQQRNRKASSYRATNHKGQCREQICVGLDFMPRHTVTP